MLRVADFHHAVGDEQVAVTRVARRHDAVEHIDTATYPFHQIFRLPDAHQVSWFIAPTAAHSEKPREFFAIAERCYPEEPRLELFARRRQPGWDVWGNEIDSDIIIPGYPVPKYSAKALGEEA